MQLADNVFIILGAYVAAFLPWTAMASSDFIDSTRKTVQDTYTEGMVHLVFVSIPTTYIVVYIILQAVSGDYKEMFTAIVALIFSLLHLARTAWGLWQLSEFKRWATASISALRAMGIEYKSDRFDDAMSPADIANALEVNNSIIDNQILHGETRCYLQCGQHALKLRESKKGRILLSRFLLACSVISFPFWLLKSFVRYIFKYEKWPLLHQIPHNPVHVSLHWLTCFAAQGLGEWIEAFQVADEPLEKEDENLDNFEYGFKAKKKYFASEVLGSAALQLFPPIRKDSHETCSPVLWEEWPGLSSENCSTFQESTRNRRRHFAARQDDLLYGLFTKHELFHSAICSGESLPFKASQCQNLIWEEGGYGEGSSGYSLYQHELKASVASLPPTMRECLSKFNTRTLDWLVILLHLGTLSNKRERVVRNIHNHKEQTFTPHYGDNIFAMQTSVKKAADKVSTRDMAIHNLRIQLGVHEENISDSGGIGEYVSSLSAFPVQTVCISHLSGNNKAVLKVGEFIDSWIALIAGEQIAHLKRDGAHWQNQPPLTCSSDKNGAFTITEKKSMRLSNHDDKASGNNGRSVISMWQYRLERARLEYQFADPSHPFWHLEQSLTFMGYGMELVRSHLACWRQENSTTEDIKWHPRVFEPNSYSTEHREVLRISDTFATEIIAALRSGTENYFRRKSVQVRLLWVLQTALQLKLEEKKDGPWSILLMIFCILSFPSLTMKEDLHYPSPDDYSVESSSEKLSSVRIKDVHTPKEKSEESFESVRGQIFIYPQGGPQLLFVSVAVQEEKEKSVSMSVSLSRRNTAIDSFFVWEWWRDAFEARLKSLSDWQLDHNLPSTYVYWDNNTLADGKLILKPRSANSGKGVTTWTGWLPFRYEFVKFELNSTDFLWQYERELAPVASRDTRLNAEILLTRNTVLRICVEYDAAYRKTIRNAIFIVQEAILDEENDFNSQNRSRLEQENQIIKKTKDSSEREAPDVDRAVHWLELAAVESNSLESMEECVRTLIENAHVPGEFERGLAILETCLLKRITEFEAADPPLESLLTAVEAETFISLFKLLSEKWDVEATISHVRFLGLKGLQADPSGEKRRCLLRSTFLRTRDYRMIQGLGDATADPNGRVSFYSRAGSYGKIIIAMYQHAFLLQRGKFGVRQNLVRAAELYQDIINNGSDPEVQTMSKNNLAIVFMSGGDGVSIDKETALKLLDQASEQGANPQALTNLLTERTDCRVFITLAGEDTSDIGVPLYERLRERGVFSFLDAKEQNLRPSVDMASTSERALQSSQVMVVVLSPEYVARKWGLRELAKFFQKIEHAPKTRAIRPVIVPVFYRLNVEQCFRAERLSQSEEMVSLLSREGFFNFEERDELSRHDITRLLARLTSYVGISESNMRHSVMNSKSERFIANFEHALNEKDCTEDIVENRRRRENLIGRIADTVCNALWKMEQQKNEQHPVKRNSKNEQNQTVRSL